MQNQKTKKIQRLRSVATDENEAPKERIIAASKLLTDFGPTERNIVVINKVVKLFANDPDYSVQERCLKLKDKLVKARGLRDVSKEELPEVPELTATEEPKIVAGTSARKVPKTLSITFDSIRQTFADTIGNSLWHFFSEGQCDLSLEQRTAILGKVLDEIPVSTANVQLLLSELNKKNQLGWNLSASFPALVRIAEEYLQAQGASVEPEKKDPDGFQRGLIDPQAAIDRVVAAGFREIPKGANDSNLLQAALGDLPLDEKSVGQLWLTLGYWFKEVLGGGPGKKGSDIMPAAARWIMACICGYANPRHLKIVSPNVFTFEDSSAFRS